MFFLFLPEKKKKILKIQRKSNLPSTFSFIKESTEAEIRRIPRANRARSLFLFPTFNTKIGRNQKCIRGKHFPPPPPPFSLFQIDSDSEK